MYAGFAKAGLTTKAGLTRPTINAATATGISTTTLLIIVRITLLKHIGDGARETVSSVIEMRQGADSELRTTNSGRNLRHWTKRMIEKVIQFENHRCRRREVQPYCSSRPIEIEIRNRSIQAHYFIAHHRRNVGGIVELLQREWWSKLVRAFKIETILAGGALGDKF